MPYVLKSYYIRIFLLIVLFWSGGGTSAYATIEIEIDPIAFALKGYSFHLIYSDDSNRFDVGVFALELPEDSRNEHYTVSFQGTGVKWDYFGDSVDGFFAGLEASTNEVLFEYDDLDDDLPKEDTTETLTTYGVRFGYRIGTDGLYLTPWLGINAAELADDVELGGQKYEQRSVIFFPTVHIGYRF